MTVIKCLPLFGVLLLLQVVAVGCVHYQFGDDLLFQSDLWSLGTYIGAISLLAAPFILAGILLIRRVSQPAQSYLVTAAYYLLGMLLIVLFEIVAVRSLTTVTLRWFHLPVYALLAGLALTYLVRKDEFVYRMERLGIVSGIVVPVFAAAMITWNHASLAFAAQDSAEPKHLLFIVLDAFPTQYLRAYNPEGTHTAMDRALSESRIFSEVRAAEPFTNHYFGTLYSGKVVPRDKDTVSPVPGGNLFAALQGDGVATRWIAYHRNGYPDSCGARVHQYRGLRSYFLTENFTWVPELLGLDYHVAINVEPEKKLDDDHPLGSRIMSWLNAGTTDYDNVLTQCLIPQLRQIRERSGRTLTIFHYRWHQIASIDDPVEKDLSKLVENGSPESANYQYGPQLEAQVRALGRRAARKMESVGENYERFLKALRNDPLLKDTTVVLTADHGSIYAKGRYGYAYHPNQEVVKLLCAVSEPTGQSGQDNRYFSTPDLTTSVLDFFDIGIDAQGSAYSIFGEGPGRDYTLTLTRNATKLNEWWLVVVRDQKKHWINLNPHGNGEFKTFQLNTYDQVELPPTEDEVRSAAPLVQDILNQYKIDTSDVHPAFRSAVEVADTHGTSTVERR